MNRQNIRLRAMIALLIYMTFCSVGFGAFFAHNYPWTIIGLAAAQPFAAYVMYLVGGYR